MIPVYSQVRTLHVCRVNCFISFIAFVTLYNNVPFIFECFHDQKYAQWCEKAFQKYQTRKSPNGQNVLLSLFSFTWASTKLSDSFMTVFTLNSRILHWAVHQPVAFSQLWSNLKKCSKDILNHDFIWDAHRTVTWQPITAIRHRVLC